MEDKRKVLLVSNAFFPEISPRSFRATELAKEFSRQGHDVTIITKYRDYDYSEFVLEYPLTLRMWDKSTFKSVPILKQKPFSLFTRILSRFLLLFFEYPGIEDLFKVKKMLKRESGYDLLISFAVPYPVHWGVSWSRSKNHRIASKWIADCGDPYMGDVLDSFRKPFYFKHFERNFCRKSDYISIPVESARPAYYPEFHNKIKVIPQGFDFDLNRITSGKQANIIPEFAYAGRFLKGIRDPELLIKYLNRIEIQFKFFVFTDQPEFLPNSIGNLDGRLIISNFVPREELMDKLAKMDFLINFDNNTHLNVPSKLIDYAILNRPVLNINKNFMFEDLEAFLNRDYRKRLILSEPETFHIKTVLQQFLDLL